MKLDSEQALLGAFLFLLPGFVWSAVYAALIPRKTDSEQIRFMEFFALSSVNNAFWSWAIYLIYRTRVYERHEFYSAATVFVVVFLSPALAGLLTANVRRSRSGALFLNWLGFKTVEEKTTAWDFKLSQPDPVWLNVLLKNGNRVYGLFGANSFAGDAGATGDLYLEMIVERGPDGSFDQSFPNQGVWIAADQIATIEFMGDPSGL
jgi:hypothetical protein